jgi:hypothetical protein
MLQSVKAACGFGRDLCTNMARRLRCAADTPCGVRLEAQEIGNAHLCCCSPARETVSAFGHLSDRLQHWVRVQSKVGRHWSSRSGILHPCRLIWPHTSGTSVPLSASRDTKAICSPLNFDFFRSSSPLAEAAKAG